MKEHEKKIQSEGGYGDYSLQYFTGPEKSYVVQPKEGEINYDKAWKDPLKFIEEISNHHLVKHTFKEEDDRVPEAKQEEEEEQDPHNQT